MSRVHRHIGKPYYFGYFYDQEGTRRCWSTKTANKKQAEEICARWEQTARAAKAQRISPERCRKIIEEGVAAIAEPAGGFPPVGFSPNQTMNTQQHKQISSGPCRAQFVSRIFRRIPVENKNPSAELSRSVGGQSLK